jgi:hypothetical protein
VYRVKNWPTYAVRDEYVIEDIRIPDRTAVVSKDGAMTRCKLLLLAIVIAGCGPLAVPMVHRPSAEEQGKIDRAWDRALSPVDKLSRQEWLDLFVGAQAYQQGVDNLHFRSEKSFTRGRVVMEVHYDREHPAKDLFRVEVFDRGGKLIRKEDYSRDDVKATLGDLFPGNGRPADKAERKEFEKRHRSRWEKIQSYFPDASDENK